MPEMTSHQPGTFCWIELGTSDDAAAKKFYTDLFRWTVNEFPMGENGELYYIFQKNGKDCAAMYKQDKAQQEQGIPPNWLSYVAVTSADAITEQAKGLGANVMVGPFDVMDFGRMSVMMDPQGAAFAVWEAKNHIGVQIRDESNTLCWNELQARDLDAAKTFYRAMGWTLKESPEYTEVHAGTTPVGGMMQSQAPPEVPSYWLPYFAVDDCDATVAQAQSGGASVFVPPMDYPGVGRFSVLADPQGAVFSVIKLELGSHQ
ncbi:MAG TPA: VOC family protein [Thermoanaerobaculia bacterium]|nr:VOC family protein [Thermoanaerobaculia bacterium]